MSTAWNRQRTYATLIGLGICILLFRTIVMMADGSLATFVPWASALLVLESLLNTGTLLGSIWWWIAGAETRGSLPLRFAAAAVIVHAVRVLIYVLGDVAHGPTSTSTPPTEPSKWSTQPGSPSPPRWPRSASSPCSSSGGFAAVRAPEQRLRP